MPATVGIEVGRDFIGTIEKQTVWDTAVEASPIIIPCDDLEITMDGGNISIPVQSGSRMLSEAYEYNDSGNKLGKATFSTALTPESANLFGFPGIFQNETPWAASTNVWTYTPLEQAALPLCKGEGYGYYYTLRKKSVVSGQSLSLHNCIGTTFKLNIHPNDHDGIWWLSTEWVGDGFTFAATPGGTPAGTALPLTTPYKWINKTTVSITGHAGVTVSKFHSAEINYTYGARRQSDSPAGECVFPEFSCTGSITLFANAATTALATACNTAAINTGLPVLIANGSTGVPDAHGDISLNMFVMLQKATRDEKSADGLTWTYEFKGIKGSGATEYPFSPVLYVT